ncbi:General secretion pathway protein K [Thioalkalivibrio nitratireducens DSM 14787]|uniref:General secretion pathway protein K n=1 Tax=Thioalkalivibrio nitratireducens (strain DSM 14787 / UNIQEM 213 / ALEN2) TaxID=1255043 RepID=L0E2M8_THIND|nr:type II secretion system protein GspK [Thioalkalivibrio nitratireducens]AGA35460.1 General secretion pathway protein K [Thioalkalivibrio nitratireducens DSM 14787]
MKQAQQGVALITALLVVAIAVTAAIGMSVRDHTQIERSGLLFEQDHARALLLGAEVMTLRMLEQVPDLGDLPWDECVSPALPLEVDGIPLVARLENLHCRFNLNSLARADDPPLAEFAALVTQAGAEAGIAAWQAQQFAAAVRDWMDPETDDPVYRLRTPPERSGNRPFLLASELNRVQGITPEIWEAVAPYVTARPGTDNLIDLDGAPDPVRDAVAAQPDEAGELRYFRLALVARLPRNDFFHCAVLDAPNGLTVVREFTSCEN